MKRVESEAVEKNVIPVTLPEGKFAAFCCADCSYRGEYNSNRNQYFCGHYRRWVDGNDSCSYGRQNSD